MTDTDLRPATAHRRSPAVRTAEHFVGVQLYLGLWLWAIVAVIAVVLTVVLDRTEGIASSTWETLDQGPRWFLFAMSIVLVAGYFPAHVATGMTRRSFSAAATVVMVLTAVAYAVVTAAGYLVERAVFAARGWPADLRDDHLFTASDQVAAVVLESGVVFGVYAASGLLVGAVYHRAGAWWGTLALPLTVGPVLVAEGLVASGWLGTAVGTLTGASVLPAGAGVLACLLVAGVLAAVAHAVLRTAPLRTPTG